MPVDIVKLITGLRDRYAENVAYYEECLAKERTRLAQAETVFARMTENLD